MSNYYRAYSNFMQVRMQQMEQKRNQYEQLLIQPDYAQITGIIKSISTPIEILLKHIHKKYQDTGLLYTLINKLFSSLDSEIAYYVPELVYIAIKKPCKPMKKLLIYRAKQSQPIRRLILWNVKAFTVLMKKDLAIKKQVDEFEQVVYPNIQQLTKHVKNITKFNHSLKAIAMLTQASLILKKMPNTDLKQKLQKFIKRYNALVLNNLQHSIIIPFRQQDQKANKQKHWNSNYVVHIVEQDCSCFPTRKRVPYRIIIETIDLQQLKNLDPNQKFNLIDKVEPDEQRDLYNQVSQTVESIFSQSQFKIDLDNIFVKDAQQNKKISQMKTFVSKLEKQEIKQKQDNLGGSMIKSKLSISVNNDQPRTKNSLSKYQIKPNQNLKKFDSIYISGKIPNYRRSEMSFNDLNSLEYPDRPEALRRSGGKGQQDIAQIQTYIQGQFKDWNMISESIWGQAWQLKKVKYSAKSNFSKFKSLRFRNVVVKGGDDLRQQIICMQLIYKMRDIIRDAKVDVFIKPYEIIVLSQNSGLLQFVSNSISIDELKKKFEGKLSKFFVDVFQDNIKKAKQCFIRSLVGSSILTFVLKLKDRHNGNILLDMDGNIIHIDFGFILGMAPGNINFQSSPFKFTREYLDLIGGKQSDNYLKFTKLFCEGMMALRKKIDQITLILEIMMEQSDLDCFKDFQIQDFKDSFKLHYSDAKYIQYCKGLVEKSCLNSRTQHYDMYQYYSNGINP